MLLKALEISQWETPASSYKVEQVGNFRIARHLYQPGFYSYHGMDGYDLFVVTQNLTATTLLELATNRLGTLRWKEWMVDSPTDYRAMQKYAEQAKGKVLTTGLGLGLVVHELCKNSKVTEITVVELNAPVIKLISKYLPDKLPIRIVCQDFWEFIDQDSQKWDSIIVDTWVYWGLEQQLALYKKEVIPAKEKLEAKYPGAWIVCHGFAGAPTLRQLKALEIGEQLTNPLTIDPFIYGLGGRI